MPPNTKMLVRTTLGPLLSLMVLVSMALWLTGSALPAFSSDSDKGLIKALQLKQVHYFFGKTELTISKVAAKLECTGQMKFVIVSRAPSWTVTLYRYDDKTYFDESLAAFSETGAVSGIMLSYLEKHIMEGAKPTSVMVCGYKATKLLDQNAEFIYLPDDHTLPPAVHDFIYAAYKLPTCNGIPLRYFRALKGKDIITQLDQTGQNQCMIATTKIRDVSVPPSFFARPSGFHKAKSIRDVVLSQQKREESADFQLMFGGSEKQK